MSKVDLPIVSEVAEDVFLISGKDKTAPKAGETKQVVDQELGEQDPANWGPAKRTTVGSELQSPEEEPFSEESPKNVSPEEGDLGGEIDPPYPLGIQVSFFSGVITVVLGAPFFYFINQEVDISYSRTIPYRPCYIFFLCLVLIRHQLRVVFIDSTVQLRMNSSELRLVFWFLLPLSVLGGLVFFVHGIGPQFGVGYMLGYSTLFLFFWFLVWKGLKKKETGHAGLRSLVREWWRAIIDEQFPEQERARQTVAIGYGIWADLGCLWALGYYFFTIFRGDTGGEEGVMLSFMIAVVPIVAETSSLYFEPVRDRLRYTYRAIRGST